MHEMSIALNIVELAMDYAKKENAQSIRQIDIDVGSLSGVLTDSLSFCFEAATKNTLAENATLAINSIPAKGECNNCNHQWNVEQLPCNCPKCGDYFVRLLAGKELQVKSITIN